MRIHIPVTIVACCLLAGLLSCGPSAERPSSAQATDGEDEGGAPQIDWSGVWDTSNGRMDLGQDGNAVAGTWHPNSGRIVGTIEAQTLRIEWTMKDEDGTITSGLGEFVLAENGQTFTGWRSLEGDSVQEPWEGLRIADRLVGRARADLEFCPWRGAWKDTGSGYIIFKQDVGSPWVTGEFIGGIWGYGTLEGKAYGWHLEFEYQGDLDTGSATLTMSADMGSFSGRWFSDREVDVLEAEFEFSSTDLREDYSGVWDTDWGEMELALDQETGCLTGSIGDASIPGGEGECEMDGRVVGAGCSFKWELTRDDGSSMSGRGMLEMAEEGTSFAGWWSVEGSDRRDWLVGRRAGPESIGETVSEVH